MSSLNCVHSPRHNLTLFNVLFNSFWFSFLVALSLQEEHEQPTGLQDEMVAEDVAKTLSDNEKTTQELME